MKKILFWSLVFWIMGFWSLAGAREFYVSPEGSGMECTQANPCALQTALDTAESNNEDDTVYLLAGTYTGNFDYSPPQTEHRSLALRGAPGTTPQEVILDGQNSGQVLALYDGSTGPLAEVLIEGLTLRNGSSTDPGGLYAILHAYDITVRHCIIHDNVGTGYGGGAYVESHHTVVFEDNVVYNNTVNERQYGWGWRSGGGGAFIDGHIAYIRNNLIYGNRAQGENCSPQGGGLWAGWTASQSYYLINNTITRNQAVQGGGVYLEWGSHYLYNNIIYQNDAGEGADIYLGSNAGGAAYHNDFADLYGTWVEEGENFAADPLFVAPDAGDFHLSEQSPCINAGANIVPDPPGLPDTDFEGDPRVMGGAVDIGADEYPGPFLQVALKVNGQDGEVTLYSQDILRIEVSVASQIEGEVDYFLWVELPGENCYCFLYPDHWAPCPCMDPFPSYRGPLFNFTDLEVFSTPCWGLPRTVYLLRFAVDTIYNGGFEPDAAVQDQVHFRIVDY